MCVDKPLGKLSPSINVHALPLSGKPLLRCNIDCGPSCVRAKPQMLCVVDQVPVSLCTLGGGAAAWADESCGGI